MLSSCTSLVRHPRTVVRGLAMLALVSFPSSRASPQNQTTRATILTRELSPGHDPHGPDQYGGKPHLEIGPRRGSQARLGRAPPRRASYLSRNRRASQMNAAAITAP